MRFAPSAKWGTLVKPGRGRPLGGRPPPFLELGIPAVDIIDFDYPYWHTTQDTTDKVSAASLATTPLPELPAATLAALPEFPRLVATSSQALDLAAGEARTFVVEADDPALYRIESTGLLATGGALRTRTRGNLLTQAENGIGRNFSLAAYLREGDYQLTVRPRGVRRFGPPISRASRRWPPMAR